MRACFFRRHVEFTSVRATAQINRAASRTDWLSVIHGTGRRDDAADATIAAAAATERPSERTNGWIDRRADVAAASVKAGSKHRPADRLSCRQLDVASCYIRALVCELRRRLNRLP